MGYNLLSIKYLGGAYALLIFSVHFTSAGLLQAIREAAVPKDMDYKLPIETFQTPQAEDPVPSESVQQNVIASPHPVTPAEESSLLATLQTSLSKLSSAIQERADVASTGYGYSKKACKAGDFLCQSGVGTSNIQNQFSKAVIHSFGNMMSEMVNTTISKNLVDFMAKHGSAKGETLAEEQSAMVHMAAGALQSVSARVIKSFTFFIQMAVSGAMWDLFQQLMDGVTSSYDKHQRNMKSMRASAALNSSPENIPKPSRPQLEFDPVKTLLNAAALTGLSYPGFDLTGSLKNNLFTGEHNNLVKKNGDSIPPVLTPFGLFHKNN